MSMHTILEALHVVRKGKIVQPQIGKQFDLTKEEVEHIQRVRPQAIATAAKPEVDPNSVDTSKQTNATANLASLGLGTDGDSKGKGGEPGDDDL